MRLLFLALAGGLVCAALVRYSPGFESEETDLDARLARDTAVAIHRRAAVEQDFIRFSTGYLTRAAHGDLGVSRAFNAPVSELLRERAAATLGLMASGAAMAWIAGVCLAWLAVWPRRTVLQMAASGIAGVTLAIPIAVVAVAFFLMRAPLSVALGMAVLPRIFGTMRELLEEAWRSPAMLCARARGASPFTLALRYVAAPMLPQLAALTGVSTVLAFGASIPIEALCDVPGIGQLAWRAALARDLPLLCALALAVTFTVALVQAAGDVLNAEARS